MLKPSDFRRGDTRYTDFVTEGTVLGKNIPIDVSFEEELGKTEETLAAAMTAINEKLGFIESEAARIMQSTIDDAHLDEPASDRAFEEFEGNEDDFEDITAEEFVKSLYPAALGFEFSDSLESCQAYLELNCDPDYFGGYRIHIEIDEENEISCDGI